MLAELRAWRRMHDVAPVTEAILRKAREGRP
jgi:hypothetical protein